MRDDSIYTLLKTDHQTVREIFEQMESTEGQATRERLVGRLKLDEKWKARVTVLKEPVEHHVREDEGEIFKKAKAIFSADLELELGAAFLAEKKRRQAEMHAA